MDAVKKSPLSIDNNCIARKLQAWMFGMWCGKLGKYKVCTLRDSPVMVIVEVGAMTFGDRKRSW